MKRAFIVSGLMTVLALFIWSQDSVPAAGTAAKPRMLYVYEEQNKNSVPYIDWFKAELGGAGFAVDTSGTSDIKSLDFSVYDLIVIHGIVMSFNMKSSVRDWLKSESRLQGKKVFVYATSGRWFADTLAAQLKDQLKAKQAQVVDAVSMATKGMAAEAKIAAVRTFVEKMR